jgi:alpha-beta hydrolase superfamily lysophospholipase
MKRGWVLVALLLTAGCGGGGSKQSVPKQPPPALAQRCGDDAQGVDANRLWFRASDGALLDGAEVGDGDVGVVLAHESESDLCPWLPFAKTLADKGYRALAFDFRGNGSSPPQYAAKATRYNLDVKAASDELRRLGAKKVFLAGASIGGAAVMAASPSVDPQPAGVLSFSGEPELLDAMGSAPTTKAPLLVMLARNDGYTSVASERRFVRAAASPDKRLVVYPADWHGWDLLYHAPYKARVNALVLDFLREHSQ